eukprot:2665303-Prymnesium_polylepis.1
MQAAKVLFATFYQPGGRLVELAAERRMAAHFHAVNYVRTTPSRSRDIAEKVLIEGLDSTPRPSGAAVGAE